MRKKFIYILIGLVTIIGILVGAGVLYINIILDEVIVKEEPTVDIKVNQALEEKVDNVENYALFGVDCRTDNYEGCRSDVMMIVSYNKDTNNVTLISVPRDTYVEISGYGFDKINHSYAYGGPMFAIQTLNKTFDLDIEHYVSVNFNAVEQIVDAIGGVEVFIESYELGHVPGIQSSGFQILNGAQALAYSRIRYVGNGDFERMERQREIMEGALEVVQTSNVTELMGLVKNLLPLVRTDMPVTEIFSLLTSVMSKGVPSLTQTQLPAINEGADTYINGIYYFVPNGLEESVKTLHELIHPSMKYIPSETVATMSETLLNILE